MSYVVFYFMSMIFILFFTIMFILLYSKYKFKTIPSYKIGLIEHNLESTPIFDILSGKQCENINNTSNILGYYFGYESGFEYQSKTYNNSQRSKYCEDEYNDYCHSFPSRKDLIIEYKNFKGTRLCTSKRPNKTYFDYLSDSISINETCKEGTKKCGKLDVNRILCVNETEKCPINDIVFNDQENYINNGIIYHSIQMNIFYTNEYIHYTNEQTDNFIITNLTVIGGDGEAFPCGSNDNNEFYFISPVDVNTFCKGDYKDYKYYFYRELSSVKFNLFSSENDLEKIDLTEYRSSTYSYEKMVLFSTGYFSLSEKDINTLKKPSGIYINDEYLKKILNYYNICYICALTFAIGFGFFLLPCATVPKLILYRIVIHNIACFMSLIIIYYSVKQLTEMNKLFTITSYIPEFIFNYEVEKIKKQSYIGIVLVSVYSFIIAYQIPFIIIGIIQRMRNGENSNLLSIKEVEAELSSANNNNITPDTPQDSDFLLKTIPN